MERTRIFLSPTRDRTVTSISRMATPSPLRPGSKSTTFATASQCMSSARGARTRRSLPATIRTGHFASWEPRAWRVWDFSSRARRPPALHTGIVGPLRPASTRRPAGITLPLPIVSAIPKPFAAGSTDNPQMGSGIWAALQQKRRSSTTTRSGSAPRWVAIRATVLTACSTPSPFIARCWTTRPWPPVSTAWADRRLSAPCRKSSPGSTAFSVVILG